MELFLPNIVTYSHRTSEENAKSIMMHGFLGSERLDYTLDYIHDKISLQYFANTHRKPYGEAVVLIQVSQELVKNNYKGDCYHKFTDEQKMKELEQQLRDADKYEGSGFDFLIPSRFIRGYILNDNEQLIENPDFNPY